MRFPKRAFFNDIRQLASGVGTVLPGSYLARPLCNASKTVTCVARSIVQTAHCLALGRPIDLAFLTHECLQLTSGGIERVPNGDIHILVTALSVAMVRRFHNHKRVFDMVLPLCSYLKNVHPKHGSSRDRRRVGRQVAVNSPTDGSLRRTGPATRRLTHRPPCLYPAHGGDSTGQGCR